jgi:hypothetical protein
MRRVLTLAAPIALVMGLAVPAMAAAAPRPAGAAAPPSCSDMCLMMYAPVTCSYSDGVTRTFDNDCAARRYACEHGLRIIGCRGAAG